MPHSPIVIIGAGPGGYTAAFRLADLGFSVTLIDQQPTLGGACLNRGCIPSKALVHVAEILREAKNAQQLGITFSPASIDVHQIRAWKDSVLTKLTGGLKQLSHAKKVNYIQGQAQLTSSTSLEMIQQDASKTTLTFEKLILATGSTPITLPSLPVCEKVWDSTKALEIPYIPSSMLVIGGGYIGLELGSVYSDLGSRVDVVEALPAMLTHVDKNIASILLRQLKKTFHQIMVGTKVVNATIVSDGIEVVLEDTKQKQQQAVYDTVLVCVGRKPNTSDLGLEKTSIRTNAKGLIDINEYCQTNEEHIFAIGDITSGPQLAHKASFQAKTVCDFLIGNKRPYQPKAIPAVIYTHPEIATCGLTEQEALSQHKDIIIAQFPWNACGRALTLNQTGGMTKIIADKKSKRILGVTIVGVHAGELIGEGALAIEKELTLEDIEQTIHPHPSLAETLLETTENALGKPIHLLKTFK